MRLAMERRKLNAVPPLQSRVQRDEDRKQLPASSPLMQFIRPSKVSGLPFVALLLVLRSLHALATGQW